MKWAKAKTIGWILPVVFLLSGVVNAAEFHVTNSQELHAALAASSASEDEDDTIYLDAGTYSGPFDDFYIYPSGDDQAGALTIKTEQGLTANQVILDGGMNGIVLQLRAFFHYADFTLDGITIQNGLGGGIGGLYASTSGNVTVTNCVIKNNSAGTSGSRRGGGAFVTSDSTISFKNNTISSNDAKRRSRPLPDRWTRHSQKQYHQR